MGKRSSRDNIFERLRAAEASAGPPGPEPTPWVPAPMEREARIEMFMELMTAMRSELYRLKKGEWVGKLKEILTERKIGTLVYGPESDIGKEIAPALKGDDVGVTPVPWEGEIEGFKEKLFAMDAGITGTMGGIAEAAALILWPGPEEPRLLSLVPPIHFAVVDADKIYTSFPEAMEKLNWAADAPTNALLISGPSKTADIELILQFGVHGPTDLIVFVVE